MALPVKTPPTIACFGAIEVHGLHNFKIGFSLYFAWIAVTCISLSLNIIGRRAIHSYYQTKTVEKSLLKSVGSLNRVFAR